MKVGADTAGMVRPIEELLLPREVDRLLRYPPGRAARLAKKSKIDHVRLPDGEIRFRHEDIARLVGQRGQEAAA